LLQVAGISVDEGPLVDLVLLPTSPPKVAVTAACIVGPNTVGKLIDMLVTVDAELKSSERPNATTREERQRLLDWVCKTGVSFFIEAILRRSSTVVPGEFSLLANLLARHGKELEPSPLQISSQVNAQMVAVVGRWAEILLASSEARRDQFAEVARAIERLAAAQLVGALQRLLAEELARWRSARAEYKAALSRGVRIRSDAQTSWALYYKKAFAAIGDAKAAEVMKEYLSDFDFGFHAACALKDIWEREQHSPRTKTIMLQRDFSEVKGRRMQREGGGWDTSPFADPIIAVINNLTRPGSTDDAHRHALQLAKIAFSMPYGNKTASIDALLRLPASRRAKLEVLGVLVRSGEIIQADMVLDGMKALLEESKAKQWLLLDQEWWEWEGWLELMPFSDRPGATIDALELIEPNRRPPWKLRGLLSALGYAPGPEADEILALLPRKDPRFFSEYDWVAALDKRGTGFSARMLLDLIFEGAVPKPAGMDAWTLSRELARAMSDHADFRAEVYARYECAPPGLGKGVIENAIAEAADADGLLTLVRSYARLGKPFDGTLHSAIRHVALDERPSASWEGAKEVFSTPLPELRKKLFAMAMDDAPETSLATACLTAIDELRDDYGPAEAEPRHPDIDSGRPWPLAVCWPKGPIALR
jgi:hypothetical protein